MKHEHKQVLSSVAVKFFPAAAGMLFSLYTIVVLTPNVIGNFVVILVVYNLIKMLLEGGMGLTLVNKNLGVNFLMFGFIHSLIVSLIGSLILFGLFKEHLVISILMVLSLMISSFSFAKTNMLRIESRYYELSIIILKASVISVIIALIDLYIFNDVRSLALRYVIFELSLVLLSRGSRIIKKFNYTINDIRLVYGYALIYLLQSSIENLKEVIWVHGIGQKMGNTSIGLYNRSAQISDALIKMPWNAFRPLLITVGFDTKSNYYINFFVFLTLSGLLIAVGFSTFFEKNIIHFLGSNWQGIGFWLLLNAFLAISYVIEQFSITRLQSFSNRYKLLVLEVFAKSSLLILYLTGFNKETVTMWSIGYFFYSLLLFIIMKIKTK